MNKSNKFSPEVRERAVRMVQEHRGEYPSLWAVVEWGKRAQIAAGARPGTTATEARRIQDLERENKELRRANAILRTASAVFAPAELDRTLKS